MAKESKLPQAEELELRNDWLDRFAGFNQHFGRFLRDAIGVGLIAAAVMTFMALGGYTDGALLTPWAAFLSLWFGWGAYLIVIAVGYTGFAFLRRSTTPLPWGQLFALELVSFLALGLFAALQGNDILRAESGADGGRIGWGLVTLFWRLGETTGNLLLFVLWLLALMSGLKIWAWLERGLMKIAGENQPVEMVIQPEVVEEAPVVEEKEEEKKEPARRKKSTPLPPEFRKSFRVSELQDKKPAVPATVMSDRLPLIFCLRIRIRVPMNGPLIRQLA